MKKKFAGYINLKPLNGIIYPSSIQNVLMKDFVQNKLKAIFHLSPTEVLQSNFPITLRTLVGSETKVNGIVMLSSFSLPRNKKIRFELYKELFSKKKEIHFILDELVLKKKEDIEVVEKYLLFNNSFFTQTKKTLNEFEKEIVKKYDKINFV